MTWAQPVGSEGSGAWAANWRASATSRSGVRATNEAIWSRGTSWAGV